MSRGQSNRHLRTQAQRKDLTKLAVRRGSYLRGYVYAFIASFAPALTRAIVEEALANPTEAADYAL